MPVRLLLIPAALLLCAAACRQPGAKPAKAAPPAPVALSRENALKVDRLYYRAVGAYTENDMEAARAYLGEILSIHPSYRPALDLREKIRKVSGKK